MNGLRRNSLKLCARFLVVADNFQVVQAHFLQKVMELYTFDDASCEILHTPKRFFGDISFYAVGIGQNLVKDKYSFLSIFTAVERIPRDKQGEVAA